MYCLSLVLNGHFKCNHSNKITIIHQHGENNGISLDLNAILRIPPYSSVCQDLIYRNKSRSNFSEKFIKYAAKYQRKQRLNFLHKTLSDLSIERYTPKSVILFLSDLNVVVMQEDSRNVLIELKFLRPSPWIYQLSKEIKSTSVERCLH